MADEDFLEEDYEDSKKVRKYIITKLAKISHNQEQHSKRYYGGVNADGSRAVGCLETQEDHDNAIKKMEPTVSRAKKFFDFFSGYWKARVITVPLTLFCLLGFLFFLGFIGLNTYKTNTAIQQVQKSINGGP